MKIPESITVGGKTYKVLFPYVFVEDVNLSGQACHEVQEIRVSGIVPGGSDRPREGSEETLMHELLHCVDQVYNAGALDEATVLRLSEGLYQALRDAGMLVD